MFRHARSAALAAMLLAIAPTAADAQAPTCYVSSGFDLFVTEPYPFIGLPPHNPALAFSGVPIGTYDFGEFRGAHDVGRVDSIVRRYGPAYPEHPSMPVPVEIVALQLRSHEVPDLYLTLQSASGGPRSVGQYHISFDGCDHGTYDSVVDLRYDLRYGGLTGPAIFSASDRLIATDVPWSNAPPGDTTVVEFGLHFYHQVADLASLRIPLVNHQLNLRDTSNDFHPGHPLHR